MAAQTEPNDESPFDHIVFGAGFEGFYQYNWNRPYDRINLLRAYDTRANVFGIQQANLIVESAPDVAAGRRFGARIDLQFGQATETRAGQHRQRAAAGRVSPRVAGLRHLCLPGGPRPPGRLRQVRVDARATRRTTRKTTTSFRARYLFNFLPFYHSGLRLSLPVSDKVTLMYMLTNGIQQTEDFNNFKSNHVAAIVKPTSKVAWTVNYYFGQEQPDGGEPDGRRLLPRLRHLRRLHRAPTRSASASTSTT